MMREFTFHESRFTDGHGSYFLKAIVSTLLAADQQPITKMPQGANQARAMSRNFRNTHRSKVLILSFFFTANGENRILI